MFLNENPLDSLFKVVRLWSLLWSVPFPAWLLMKWDSRQRRDFLVSYSILGIQCIHTRYLHVECYYELSFTMNTCGHIKGIFVPFNSKFYLVLVDGHTYCNKVWYSGPWRTIKNVRISFTAAKPFFSLVDNVRTVGLLFRVVPWASPQTSIPGSIPGLGTGRLLRSLSLWKKKISMNMNAVDAIII